KTTEGELGIQSGHEPLLGELDAGGTVTVYTDEGRKVAAVRGGFLSVTAEKVSILGEEAHWSGTLTGPPQSVHSPRPARTPRRLRPHGAGSSPSTRLVP